MEILVPQKFRTILYSIGVLYDKFCELFMKITKLKTPIKYMAYVRTRIINQKFTTQKNWNRNFPRPEFPQCMLRTWACQFLVQTSYLIHNVLKF